MSRELNFPAAALAALAKGQRIEAIKLLREANSGMDLRGAMEAVDAYASGRRDFSIGEPLPAVRSFPPGQLPAEAAAAVSRGQLIEAIKIVRERHGLGLKEAKDLVDRYRSDAIPASVVIATTEVQALEAPGGQVPKAALEALARGDLADAVKIMQETGGLGLKQALAVIETHKRRSPQRTPTVAAGDNGSGWLWMAILLAALVGVYFWLA